MLKRTLLTVATLLALSPAYAATICEQAIPATGGLTVQARSGNTYTTNANGIVCGVTPGDINDLDTAGFMPINNANEQYYDVTLAAVNTPVVGNVLTGINGHTIYPLAGGLTLMASGTAAGATSIGLYCSGTGGPAFGNMIALFPVAALVDKVTVTPFMVASAVSYGSAITRGCPSGQGIIASTNGSALTTTTDLFLQLPVFIQ
jgi:hypothetical protein